MTHRDLTTCSQVPVQARHLCGLGRNDSFERSLE
jgi:hypothetical protein